VVLASFHGSAARSPEISRAATGVALRAKWEANFLETERFVGTILDDVDYGEIRMRPFAGWTVERDFSVLASPVAGCVTAMGIFRPMTSTVSMTGSGSSIASSSQTGCATWTSAPMSPPGHGP